MEYHLKKSVHYWSPQKKENVAQSSTQRDSMGREEGGGFGMGNTYIPVADSC